MSKRMMDFIVCLFALVAVLLLPLYAPLLFCLFLSPFLLFIAFGCLVAIKGGEERKNNELRPLSQKKESLGKTI